MRRNAPAQAVRAEGGPRTDESNSRSSVVDVTATLRELNPPSGLRRGWAWLRIGSRRVQPTLALSSAGIRLTGCLPDVRHKAVRHFLAIGPVAFQIACQQLLLAKDAQNEQPDYGQTCQKTTNGAEQQPDTNGH